MDKSPEAFRTISEVAEEMDLPQHVLRFWETRFPQIKPLKRGGGRRAGRLTSSALAPSASPPTAPDWSLDSRGEGRPVCGI